MATPTQKNFEGRGQIFFNGRVIADATKVNLKINTNDNDVTTFGGGYAGSSDGATTTDITIDLAVARKGFESDFLMVVTQRKPVSITMKAAGKRITVGCKVRDFDLTQDVASAASASLTLKGGEPQIVG